MKPFTRTLYAAVLCVGSCPRWGTHTVLLLLLYSAAGTKPNGVRTHGGGGGGRIGNITGATLLPSPVADRLPPSIAFFASVSVFLFVKSPTVFCGNSR